MLKMSMKVMKANPNVIKMAQEQMAKMSPEQMKQASDLAQKQMEAMAPEDLEKMADSAIAGAGGPQVVDVDVEEDAPARNARDEALVDALFVVAAAMSKQPGAVTLEAFKQLPPIQSLRGELPDDLSDAEIADAWAEAGLAVGAAADKTAFTRAWLALDQSTTGDLRRSEGSDRGPSPPFLAQSSHGPYPMQTSILIHPLVSAIGLPVTQSTGSSIARGERDVDRER